VIKKLTPLKIFNAGAIIATSRRQLLMHLCKARCMALRRSVTPFCTAQHFTQPTKPMLYNVFQSAIHPQ